MPDATGLELLAQELRDSVAGSFRDAVHTHGKGAIEVEPQAITAGDAE